MPLPQCKSRPLHQSKSRNISKCCSWKPDAPAVITDSKYFLIDASCWKDTLPQPYRMLDKVLNDLLESVWDLIQRRQHMKESQRVSKLEESEPPPAPLPCSPSQTIKLPRINCCCGCYGVTYLSLGTKDGLYLLDSSTQQICTVWKTDNSEITSVSQCAVDKITFIISALDDIGVARLFVFREPNNLVCMLSTFEQNEEANQTYVSYCATSPRGDYFGVIIQGPENSNEDNYLEIYKLPSNVHYGQYFESRSSISQISGDTVPSIEKPAVTLFAKIPNISAPQPCKAPNISHILKGISSTGDVIGSGSSHVLSKAYLEARSSTFTNSYPASWTSLLSSEEIPRKLNFMFRQSTTSVESYTITYYTDPLEVDMLWPFAASITAVTISSCANWIVVGLENGFIVIWDFSLGLVAGMLDFSQEGPIKDLNILSTMSPSNDPSISENFQLIAVLNSGEVQHIYYKNRDFTTKKLLSEIHFPEATLNKVTSIYGIDELILMSFNNGVILLTDITNSRTLCELILPSNYSPIPKWNPVVVSVKTKLNSSENDTYEATYIYVNGFLGDGAESPDAENSSFFIFQLDTIEILEKFCKVNETPSTNGTLIENSLESLVENTLKDRYDIIYEYMLHRAGMKNKRQGYNQLVTSIVENQTPALLTITEDCRFTGITTCRQS
ncbi:WD repeat-containing protein 93-like [Argonauta hians]